MRNSIFNTTHFVRVQVHRHEPIVTSRRIEWAHYLTITKPKAHSIAPYAMLFFFCPLVPDPYPLFFSRFPATRPPFPRF